MMMVIKQLKKIHDYIDGIFIANEEDVRPVNESLYIIEQLIKDMEARSRWYTPEQWKELTGEEWPEAWGVYTIFDGGWFLQRYREAQLMRTYTPITIVCATEAGRPPDDWKPEAMV
jgi:hypothetical protein